MPRRNANTDTPAPRRAPAKRAKRKPTDKRKPNTTDPPPDDAVVSRTTLIRHTGRGGRGR